MRIDVLDQGYVELQDVMGTDLDIVNAARTSFLGDSKGQEADKRLLFFLYRNKHMSPFEMAIMKFKIRAPLVTFWQLVRHRTASINMQSGRYTVFQEDAFYIPEVLRLQSSSNKQASAGDMDKDKSDELLRRLQEHYKAGYALYTDILNAGGSKEIARLALSGFAVYYDCVWTCDVRNIMHFLGQRLAPEAQLEIRVYAEAIHKLFSERFPWCADAVKEHGWQ